MNSDYGCTTMNAFAGINNNINPEPATNSASKPKPVPEMQNLMHNCRMQNLIIKNALREITVYDLHFCVMEVEFCSVRTFDIALLPGF